MKGERGQGEGLEPYWGRVMLRPAGEPGGQMRQTTIAALMRHRDCRVSSRSASRIPAAGRGRQPPAWKDLTGQQQRLLELRLAHLLEVETGFPGGDPFRAGTQGPRPEYEPGLAPRVTDRPR